MYPSSSSGSVRKRKRKVGGSSGGGVGKEVRGDGVKPDSSSISGRRRGDDGRRGNVDFSSGSSPIGEFSESHNDSSSSSDDETSFPFYLSDLLRDAKKQLQDPRNGKKNGVTYALFGSSGSGKSTLLRKIFIDDVYSNREAQNDNEQYICQLFTESKHADPIQGIDEENLVVDACGVDPEIYKWMYGMNYNFDKMYNFVVMTDDVITVKNLPIIFKAFLIYRNMNITSVVSLQYLKLCPLSVRGSLYFCLLLPLNSNEGIEQLVKGYLGMYLPGRTLNEKIRAYKEMAKDYHFFLMDNLNHKCYYCNDKYYCREMTPRPFHERLFMDEESDDISAEAMRKIRKGQVD